MGLAALAIHPRRALAPPFAITFIDSQTIIPPNPMRNPLSRSNTLRAVTVACTAAAGLLTSTAHAVSSAELYTTDQYPFGRFEARIQFGSGDGIISSFFMWKDGSEMSGVFWNELDFEKLRANCELETNALYGMPESSHNEVYEGTLDLCGTFHTYAYEWTPDYIAWFIDGTEIRREIGDVALAYAQNAPDGMQIRFNIWPGDDSFGGTFDPAVLPVHEYVNWVQYSSFTDGQFQLEWREDFAGTSVPSGWAKGSWDSPKGLSTHDPANANVVNGYLVLSLTADEATGSAGAAPSDPADVAPVPTTPTVPTAEPTVPAPSTTAPATTTPVVPPTAPTTTATPANGDSGSCTVSGTQSSGARSSLDLALLGLALFGWRRGRARRQA